jgi:hypothetical protein
MSGQAHRIAVGKIATSTIRAVMSFTADLRARALSRSRVPPQRAPTTETAESLRRANVDLATAYLRIPSCPLAAISAVAAEKLWQSFERFRKLTQLATGSIR